MVNHEIRRGDIFYIDRFGYQKGSEQYSGRPGVIVSNDMNNKFSKTVEVVYCTTKPKEDLPTHVNIFSTGVESTVLCEQVTTVSVDKLASYYGPCTEDEMRKIDEAILVSLGIQIPKAEKAAIGPNSNPQEAHLLEFDNQIVALETERDTYKKMYESLLNRIVPVSKFDME